MKRVLFFLSLILSVAVQAQSLAVRNFDDWSGGYRVTYEVTNDTAAPIDGWLAVIEFPAGAIPGDVSTGRFVESFSDTDKGIYAFRNETYNGSLAVGGTAEFAFNVEPDNGSTPPTSGDVTFDFDPSAVPRFSISNATLLEGDLGTKSVELTVRLSSAIASLSSVNYETVDGSAIAGADYDAVSGMLVFPAGEVEQTVSVAVIGDLVDEGDEFFEVRLSGETGAGIANGESVVTIIENDVVPDLSIADGSAREGEAGATASFVVSLTPASASAVTVSYATSDGTADRGDDYTAVSGVLTFSPGETRKVIGVALLDDELEELTETFQVTLSGQTSADLGRAIATGSILDDESSGNGRPATGMFNYAEALQKSMYFYEAQRSGDLPETNRVAWRGDSALNDGDDVGVDLVGGWYDAGDHVKFGFPMAYSATLLAWGGQAFEEGYVESGQYNFLVENLRWVCDYFLKCHEIDGSGETVAFWGQVGNGNVDHSYWGPPEVFPLERPSYKIDRANPGTDLACETAAALASCSMIFREIDPAYADTLLENARALYRFGDNFRGVYSDSIPDAANFYNSFSGFEDELLWSALWMYKATGEDRYRSDALDRFNSGFPDNNAGRLNFGPSWDDKNYGSVLLVADLLQNEPTNALGSRARDLFRGWIRKWVDGSLNNDFVITPGGFRWLIQWGSARYACNAASHALLYAKLVEDPDGSIQAFGESQINYVLGDNPQNVSYVIGFGDDFPTHPHHRAAHGGYRNDGPETDAGGNQVPSRNILFGGLVGGPITPADNGWIPWRFDRDGSVEAFQANEVANDYNAGFTAGVARMYELHGGLTLQDFPPEAVIPAGSEIFVSAAVTSDEPRFTQVRFFVNNRSYAPARPATGLTFRYYLDLTELFDNGLTEDDVSIAFNPVGINGGRRTPTISGLQVHDEDANVYFIEVDLQDQNPLPIGNSDSRTEVQIRFGLRNSAPANIWNSSNDFSFQNIASGASNIGYTGFIPTFQNAVLVDGLVPSGGEVMAPAAFDQWRQTQFTAAELADETISGPLADADGDGHTNIVEYAFGQDPQLSDPSEIVSTEIDPVSGRTTVRFPANPLASDVAIVLEGSSDLSSTGWSELPTRELPASTNLLRVLESDFPADESHYFYRTFVRQR